jgi:hypothetical protein
MKSLCILSVVLMLSSVWIGCGDDSEDEEHEEELPEVDCDDGVVVEYEDVSAFDKCVTCHDSSKSGDARAEAPDDVNFDTAAAAEKSAVKAAEEVNEGAMPPPGSGITITAAQKEDLYRWALCPD